MVSPVDPHLGFLGSPRGQCFSSGGQAVCCIVVLDCQLEGFLAGSLRTEVLDPKLRLGSWVRIWQAQSTDLNLDLVHLKSGRGSDDRSGWTFCP